MKRLINKKITYIFAHLTLNFFITLLIHECIIKLCKLLPHSTHCELIAHLYNFQHYACDQDSRQGFNTLLDLPANPRTHLTRLFSIFSISVH